MKSGSVPRCIVCNAPATTVIAQSSYCTCHGVATIASRRRRRRGCADVAALLISTVLVATIVRVVAPTPSPTISPLPAGQINYYAAAGARASGLDPALIRAVIGVESGGDPRAVSRAGAVGIMQLMASTASDCGIPDRYDALANVQCGSRALATLIHQYGLPQAIEAYNYGANNVARVSGHLSRMPLETQRYVVDVVTAYDHLQHIALEIAAPQQPLPPHPRRSDHGRAMVRKAMPLPLPYFVARLFTDPIISERKAP
ncbi:MAG: lytic transglycosylase domain-containing protein [Candidatus Cybelea sp.]